MKDVKQSLFTKKMPGETKKPPLEEQDPNKTIVGGGEYDPNKTVVGAAGDMAGFPPDFDKTQFPAEIKRQALDPLDLDRLPGETDWMERAQSLEELATAIDANETDMGTRIRMANAARGLKRGLNLKWEKIPEKYRSAFARLARQEGLANKIDGLPDDI